MHELGRVTAVLSGALGKAKGRKIKKLVLELTSGGHSDEEEFRFLFEAEAKGTLAEGAELEIEFVDNAYSCNACKNKEKGLEFEPIRCTKCGSPDLKKTPSAKITGIVF